MSACQASDVPCDIYPTIYVSNGGRRSSCWVGSRWREDFVCFVSFSFFSVFFFFLARRLVAAVSQLSCASHVHTRGVPLFTGYNTSDTSFFKLDFTEPTYRVLVATEVVSLEVSVEACRWTSSDGGAGYCFSRKSSINKRYHPGRCTPYTAVHAFIRFTCVCVVCSERWCVFYHDGSPSLLRSTGGFWLYPRCFSFCYEESFWCTGVGGGGCLGDCRFEILPINLLAHVRKKCTLMDDEIYCEPVSVGCTCL